MKPLYQHNVSDYNYSTTSYDCTCSSETGRHSFRRLVAAQGYRINQLANSKYIPVRRNSLIDELVKTKTLYEQLCTQYVSSTDATTNKQGLLKCNLASKPKSTSDGSFSDAMDKVVSPKYLTQKKCSQESYKISETPYQYKPQTKSDTYTCISNVTQHYYREALKRILRHELTKKQSCDKSFRHRNNLKYNMNRFYKLDAPANYIPNRHNKSERKTNYLSIKRKPNDLNINIKSDQYQFNISEKNVVSENKNIINTSTSHQKSPSYDFNYAQRANKIWINPNHQKNRENFTLIPKELEAANPRLWQSPEKNVIINYQNKNNKIVPHSDHFNGIKNKFSTDQVQRNNCKNNFPSNYLPEAKLIIKPHSNSESKIIKPTEQKEFCKRYSNKKYIKKYKILNNNANLLKQYRLKLKCLQKLISQNSYHRVPLEAMQSKLYKYYEEKLREMQKLPDTEEILNNDLLTSNKTKHDTEIPETNASISQSNSVKIQVNPIEVKVKSNSFSLGLKKEKVKSNDRPNVQEDINKRTFLNDINSNSKSSKKANKMKKGKGKVNNKILQTHLRRKSTHTNTVEISLPKYFCCSNCSTSKTLEKNIAKSKTRSKGTMVALNYMTINPKMSKSHYISGPYLLSRKSARFLKTDRNSKTDSYTNNMRIKSKQKENKKYIQTRKAHRPSKIFSKIFNNNVIRISGVGAHTQTIPKFRESNKRHAAGTRLNTKYSQSDHSKLHKFTLIQNQGLINRPKKYENNLKKSKSKSVQHTAQQEGRWKFIHLKDYLKYPIRLKKLKKASNLNFTEKNSDFKHKYIDKYMKVVKNIDSKANINKIIKKISGTYKITNPTIVHRLYSMSITEIK